MQQKASIVYVQDKPQKPLRVLMVTGVYPTVECPHAGTFIKSQVDSLRAAGLEVEVLHPKPGPSWLRYSVAAIQVFCKTLTKRFDIVHGHYGLWCLLARLQWTTPVIASYLGDDVLGTVTIDGTYSSKGRFVAAISHKLCYLVDAVIVKSEQMKQKIRTSQQKIFVIPNGVNFSQFHPIPRSEARTVLGWDQDRYYVLFGNNPNIPVKNFALAHASIEILRAKGIDVELVVATGLPHDSIVKYINASNALILSSKAEGSPNIVKETMACNIPVVATDVGDVASVIGHTEGCSVCTHNAEDLANALQRALEHKGPTTGRQDIHHLDSATIAQRVIAVYQQAINKNVDSQREIEKKIQNSSKDKAHV